YPICVKSIVDVFQLVTSHMWGRQPYFIVHCLLTLYYNSFCFITLAGLPTTVARSGISRITTAPAPTVHHFPILTPCITQAPIPTCVPSPTITFPANAT